MEGYVDIKPTIKKLAFEQKGKFELYLEDGRIITVPLSIFPEIKKLTSAQRKKWYIIDDVGFSFDDCDEVYHMEQVLGRFENYKYSFS
ncbi:hypothetical protein BH11BAC1_BH11BAC1_17960 [soil metagenome]